MFLFVFLIFLHLSLYLFLTLYKKLMPNVVYIFILYTLPLET